MVEKAKGAFNLAALLSLLYCNFAMMINQTNIASTFSFISLEFNSSVYGLGILTSAFFLAYGAFEVPGGIWAAKVGPKKIALAGAALNTVGVLGSAVAPGFGALTAFRFVAGFGFSFAFPSLLVLIVRYYRKGSEGFGVALMSISSSGGSLAGLFGWAVLASVVGWRASLLSSGAFDAVAVVLLVALVPADTVEPSFKIGLGHLRRIVTDKGLAVLSICLFGAGATVGLVTNFMVYYLEGNFGVSPGLAGGIASVSAVMPMISAPIMGRAYDRVKNVRLLLLGPAAVITFGVALAAVDSIYASVVAVVLVGLGSGAIFTIGLAAPREVSSSGKDYEALTVGWVDSFSLFGNVASPLYFSALVLSAGYPTAWLVGGSVAVLLALPVLTISNDRFRRQETRTVVTVVDGTAKT